MQIKSKGAKAFQIFDVIFLTLLGLIFVIPYLLILAGSLTDESAFLLNGYTLWPSKWSFEAYRSVFATGSEILSSFWSSILITVSGTAI